MEAQWPQHEETASRGCDVRASSANPLLGNLHGDNAEAGVASSSPRSHRPVGGCIGNVFYTGAGRLGGGCVGVIDDSGGSATLDMRRPVGGCAGHVYHRSNTRFVGGCVGSIDVL